MFHRDALLRPQFAAAVLAVLCSVPLGAAAQPAPSGTASAAPSAGPPPPSKAPDPPAPPTGQPPGSGPAPDAGAGSGPAAPNGGSPGGAANGASPNGASPGGAANGASPNGAGPHGASPGGAGVALQGSNGGSAPPGSVPVAGGAALPTGLPPITIETQSSRFPTEPWSDDDYSPRRRIGFGDFGVSLNAEYRANGLVVNPISLNTTSLRNASWIEHRMRLDLTADWQDKVRIYLSADVLDGVLWGDNGTYGGKPSSNAGVGASTKNPNVTRPCVALATDGDPLQASSYGYTLCEQSAVNVRKLYTHISTPIGALRIGRQSMVAGAGVQSNDGEGRTNRFGFARTGNVVDRILFATKPLEAFKPKDKRNTSESEGLILAFGYDRLVTDSPQLWSDDVAQWFTSLIFRMPEHALGTDLFASAYHVYRWNPSNATAIHSMGLRAMTHFPAGFSAGFDVAYNTGSTREVAESYKVITNDPVVDQQISQLGARAVVRWDSRVFGAYMEVDYASGDPDPNNRTPLTQFTFAEDSNVGLLLFEHVLAFQTARASAAGVETIRRLGAKGFPAEVVNTRGAFTNAFALFPQVDVKPTPDLLIRGGVLFAWAAEPVIDPVASLQARDGLSIQDDLVNFVGGPSLGRMYYGTEFDGRVRYRMFDHVNFDLEGAILLPGNALQNKQGEAVRSGMVQGRVTAFF